MLHIILSVTGRFLTTVTEKTQRAVNYKQLKHLLR